MLKVIKGNLLQMAEENMFDVIVHGANCFHAMGSGIAGQIAKRYPNVPQVDAMTTTKGAPDKMTKFSVAEVTKVKVGEPQGEEVFRELKKSFLVVNLYTQYRPGADFIESMFELGMKNVLNTYGNQRIGIPYIGAGIGGGNPEQILRILTNISHDKDVTLVLY